MPTQTTPHSSRRRERPTNGDHRRLSDDLPGRISNVREQVFELVTELRRNEATKSPHVLDRADQMQSIANQLGAIEAAISRSGS